MPPDVAERQDVGLIGAILDYRNAQRALELFHGGDEGRKALGDSEHLMGLLVRLHRAQGDSEYSAAHLRAQMDELALEEPDDG